MSDENINNEKEVDTNMSEIVKKDENTTPDAPPSDIVEIRCPLCPKFAKITINHIQNEIISECPDNHFMKLDYESFFEKSTDHPLSATKCSICHSNEQAEHYCLECNKYFCKECLEKHNKNELIIKSSNIHSNILQGTNLIDNQNKITSNITINSTALNCDKHHVISILEQDNNCAFHSGEKFVALCIKCNKSFCIKCIGEIKKGVKGEAKIVFCEKNGINHTVKKIKDVMGPDRLKKIKHELDNEIKVINFIEIQSNMIIEQIMNKINNLKQIHQLKNQLFNLFLRNRENTSLIKTMYELSNGFKLKTEQFNDHEKFFANLEIINKNEEVKLDEKKIINKEEENKDDKNELKKKEEEKKLKHLEEKKKKILEAKMKKEEAKMKKEEIRKKKEEEKRKREEDKKAKKEGENSKQNDNNIEKKELNLEEKK